ncbi:MAG TPA: TonB-dependent receptor [Bryobacteraceae bacterium]|nr:TonB-dependent receptor [Bryobacteraceae bacterium]
MYRLIARFTLAVLLAGLGFAQTDLATLRGLVTDQTGASVPNAKLSLLNVGTNTSRESVSNENGDFEIPYVVQGTYTLTVMAQGFKNFVASDLLIRAREMRRVDVKLELGAVGSEVTVTGGAAVIATEGAQISSGFSREAFVNSPLSQSFFPQAYMTTLPNIQTQQGGWALRFAGQASAQVSENMDGVPNDGTVNLVQNMQDFEDLNVVAVNNTAEYSRVAQFSMASKGGSNTFHGRVYYDMVNSALRARTFFEARKIPYKEHRGGANFSGPIIKNKLFFYTAYSLVRIPSSSLYIRDVPTTAMRNGDFTGLATIYDPFNGRTPFPDNKIPANRINPVSAKTRDLFIPTPNRGAAGGLFQNYQYVFPWPTDLYKWDSVTERVDWVINSKNQLFGRFINRLTPYVLQGPFENLGAWTRSRNHHSIAVNDTHTFSPRLVNTFLFGWARDYFIDGESTGGFTPQKGDAAVAAIGLQGVNRGGYSVMGFPTMTITGVQQLRQQPGGVNLNRNDLTFTDSLTYSLGRHVFKTGAALRTFRDFNGGIPEGNYGTFTFDGSMTGDGTRSGVGFADFLLGTPQTSTRLDPITNRVQHAYELGLFVTDTFKVSSKLTLDLGLRWDFFRHARYEDGLQYNWDPVTGSVMVPQEAIAKISPLYPKTIPVSAGNVFPSPKKTNFRPRLGAAYRITEKFVVRGGYGIYTETLGPLHRAQGTGPFQIAETYVNSIVNGAPFLTFPNPYPSTLAGAGVPSQSVVGYPMDTDNGMIHQFNLSIEREIGRFGLRGSYVGSRSRGLNYAIALNKPQPSLIRFTADRRPYPQYVGATYNYSDGASNYDSTQFEVTRRMGGFFMNAHYTFSNASSNFLNLENPYKHDYWNRDQFNSRHRFVFNSTYDLPIGKGRHYLANAPKIADYVVGGWQLGWITYLQSGQYFTPTFSGSDPSNTNTLGGIPDRIGDGNLDSPSPDRWFDPSAFAVPPQGRFGNSGANILEGPGLNLHHFSAVKDFHITERVKFVLQAMLTNAFNHPHFDFPAANISVPGSVGRVTQLREGGGGREMSGARQLQFRFRVEF